MIDFSGFNFEPNKVVGYYPFEQSKKENKYREKISKMLNHFNLEWDFYDLEIENEDNWERIPIENVDMDLDRSFLAHSYIFGFKIPSDPAFSGCLFGYLIGIRKFNFVGFNIDRDMAFFSFFDKLPPNNET